MHIIYLQCTCTRYKSSVTRTCLYPSCCILQLRFSWLFLSLLVAFWLFMSVCCLVFVFVASLERALHFYLFIYTIYMNCLFSYPICFCLFRSSFCLSYKPPASRPIYGCRLFGRDPYSASYWVWNPNFAGNSDFFVSLPRSKHFAPARARGRAGGWQAV